MTTELLPDPPWPPLTEDAASAWASVLLDLHARQEVKPTELNRDTTDKPEPADAATGV
jgi:hypothetical protein